MTRRRLRGLNPGPGVDARGQQVVDPTENVLGYVDAAVRRQDDLRESEAAHIREVIRLRASIADVRDRHAHEVREGEAARLDAIRSTDIGAVNRAAEVGATQATTLAAQVATSAETLRTQVAAAASAATIALTAALEPVQKDIADLRRAQYEAQGQKAQVVETREIGGARTAWSIAAIAVLMLVSGAVLQQLGAIRKAQYEVAGGRAQVVEQRAASGHRGQWWAVAAAVAAVLATLFIGISAIVVTLILHG